MKKFLLILLFVVLLTPLAISEAGQQEGHYQVTHVVDGDTFDATDGHIIFRVRVVGMDAPEYQQSFWKWATTELRKLIEGKEIVIHPIGKGLDRYNRILGQVLLNGEDISLLMIRRGFAFYYRPRCRDYPEDKRLYEYDPTPCVNAEAEAQASHLVIWSDKFMELPCQFRREHPHH